MPEKKLVNINDVPKWFKAFYVFAPIVGLLMISAKLDNDFYFIYKTGEYIVSNGFPHTDFLSMHTGMEMIPQQWLTGVLFYFLYSRLGEWGVIGLVYVCYLLLCYFMHKLTLLITDNLFIASAVSFFADLFMAIMFERTRPQAITYVIIVAFLYCLESYVQKKKIVYLVFLPVLSLLQINLHCSMWIMLFVFAAPYAAAALPVKIGKIKQEPCCSFIKLLICGIVCFAVGFINPYGLEAITYITTSFGYKEIDGLIVEMQKPSLAGASGIILYGIFAVMVIIAMFAKKRSFTTRFVLLFAGTVLMSMLNIKSIAYFLIGGMPAFAYMMKDAEIVLKIDEKQERSNKDKKKLIVLTALFVVMLGVLAGTLLHQSNNTESYESKAQEEYEALDEIIAILDEENKGDVVLYASFNQGQYFEFHGYHPYIDGRAELFLKDNNKEFNYLGEYNDLKNSKIYYKDFVNKYNFNYIVTDPNSPSFTMSLKHDEDFEVVYESEFATLFKLKDAKS